MMVIDNKFEIGDMVYVVHETEAYQYQVLAIKVVPGAIVYGCQCGETSTWCYDFELTTEKPVA